MDLNPNDLVLRAELLEAYDSLDQYNVYYSGHTPDVVGPLIRHNLWFIQNIPDQTLYSLGSELAIRAPRRQRLGPHAILARAVEEQLKCYPKNLKIGLSLAHYYPYGFEKEALKILRKLIKTNPNNRELQQRIKHCESLLDRRSLRLDTKSKARKKLLG